MSLGNPCRNCAHEQVDHWPDSPNSGEFCVGGGRQECECVWFQPVPWDEGGEG